MTYHALSDSGMNPDDRRKEAERIIPMLLEPDVFDVMKPHEQKFVLEMDDGFDTCSTRQLFWLRDLKAAYVE